MKKILPIGAVVLLKDAVDSLMIIGYLPKGNDEKERDYMGVVYPIGLVSLEDVRAFNHEDIQEIKFNGYENNILFDKFMKKLDNKDAFKH